MESAFDILWRFNLQFSLLLTALLLVRWLLKKSANIYNAYPLWAFLPLAPICASLAAQLSLSTSQISIFKELSTPLFVPQGIAQILNEAQGGFSTAPIDPSATHYVFSTATELLLMVWVFGGVFFLLRLMRQHCLLRAKLKTPEFTEALNLNEHTPVSYRINGVTKDGFSPAVYGFLKPEIYFPTTLYSELNKQQRSLILQHEVQHIRQGHLWLNLAWDLLVCSLWFNPILYWSRRAFRHDQELFCDYLVLCGHDQQSQKAYGHALISTVSATHSVSLLCSWKMFNQLEERILNIKSNRPTLRKITLSSSVVGLLSVSSMVAIAAAGDPINNTKTAEPSSISIIKINTDDKKQITIKTEEKTYRQDGGHRVILEDGKQRQLTRKEEQEFEKLIEKSVLYASSTGSEKRDIFEQQNVHSFTFEHDGEFSVEEFEKRFENVKPKPPLQAKRPATPMPPAMAKEVRLFRKSDHLDDTDLRIQRALKHAEGSEGIAVKRARKRLKETQKELARRQEALTIKKELAHKQLQELQELQARQEYTNRR